MLPFLNEYRLYIILTVAAVFCYFWISQFKEQLRIKEWRALVLSVMHTLVGVICVKLFAFLESGTGGGMSLYGAIFFLPVVYWVTAKVTQRSVADVFDIFAVCTFVTLLCSRFNCLFAGCCLGAEIPGTVHLRWPTREAEMIFYVVLYIGLRKKVCQKRYSGLIYPIYMMAYGGFRFIVEFFRESEHTLGWFHISHLWSAVAVLIGVGCYMWLLKNKKLNKKGENRK